MKINHYKKKSHWQEAKSWSVNLHLCATWGQNSPIPTSGIFSSFSWTRNNSPNKFSINFTGSHHSHETHHQKKWITYKKSIEVVLRGAKDFQGITIGHGILWALIFQVAFVGTAMLRAFNMVLMNYHWSNFIIMNWMIYHHDIQNSPNF